MIDDDGRESVISRQSMKVKNLPDVPRSKTKRLSVKVIDIKNEVPSDF